MSRKPEYIEGPEAWERFKKATRAVLTVTKSDMPPSPFGKRAAAKKKKPATRKG